jgi:hypothetical protein
VDRCFLQSGVVIELVQHVRLLVAVSSEDDVDDDVLNDLYVSYVSKICTTELTSTSLASSALTSSVSQTS